MKKDFKDFVGFVAIKWRVRRILLEQGGQLVGISKREQGDVAEDWVVKRIALSSPTYEIVKSPGSRTPADIFALARRKDYWHIMLIQVKSSFDRDDIYKLNKKEIKIFAELVKIIKDAFNSTKFKDKYSDKAIIVSSGYAGVWRIETTVGVQHRLQDAYMFESWGEKMSKRTFDNSQSAIEITHQLNIR